MICVYCGVESFNEATGVLKIRISELDSCCFYIELKQTFAHCFRI